MSNSTFDELYGNKGIDTPYERETVTYRPNMRYTKEDIHGALRPEVKQSIERARTFTISHNLSEYDELIQEVDRMLRDIEARNPKENMTRLNGMLSKKQFKEIISFEKQQSSYTQTGDYELYSLLFHMKESMQVRREFLDQRFRTQFTNETDIQKIEEAELKAIDEWEQLEAQAMDGYARMATYDEDNHEHSMGEDSLSGSQEQLDYEQLESIEFRKRNREILHTSLADTSYIHRNRYFMFLNTVERAKTLVYESTSLIDKNLKSFMMSLGEMPNLSTPKTHLILQFRKVREKHEGLKGRMMTIEDEKETFASEKQYMYQQLETKTVEPMKKWLHNQDEEISGALDLFSRYMVKSMKDSRSAYEETLADMLNFYKSESDFYEQQINFLKDKEEIRKFYRILEDLEDVEQIRGEWVDEYLKVNGYTV